VLSTCTLLLLPLLLLAAAAADIPVLPKLTPASPDLNPVTASGWHRLLSQVRLIDAPFVCITCMSTVYSRLLFHPYEQLENSFLLPLALTLCRSPGVFLSADRARQ
jgi:hypothetical protein